MDYQEAKSILEKQNAAIGVLEQYRKIESAHEQHGFNTRGEFIKALLDMDQGVGKKRARLTPEDRKAIEAAIIEGMTASAIAKKFGISQPYVYALKRPLQNAGGAKQKSK